jgi:phosphoglycolate phosphatase
MNITPAKPCRLFLFDLDGTLIDSRADIAFSLNLALEQLNLKPLPEARIAEFVGDGVHKLVDRLLREATGRQPDEALARECTLLFRKEYAKHLLDQTRLFPGVLQALDLLSWARFAVVSNKPEGFCRRILEGLGVAERFCVILGGDSTPNRKPSPEPLQKAMEACAVSPMETVMVGDSAADIRAGAAAGVTTCGIPGNFRSKTELEEAGCDLLLDSLPLLANYFCPPE